MTLDITNFGWNLLDTNSTNIALNPYGLIGSTTELNSTQKSYFESLENSTQSKVKTLAAHLHTKPDLLEAISYQIEEWNTFHAQTMLMQVVDEMKRVKLDETKFEYYLAIHEYITLLSQSNYGNQIDRTRQEVHNVLERPIMSWDQDLLAA